MLFGSTSELSGVQSCTVHYWFQDYIQRIGGYSFENTLMIVKLDYLERWQICMHEGDSHYHRLVISLLVKSNVREQKLGNVRREECIFPTSDVSFQVDRALLVQCY